MRINLTEEARQELIDILVQMGCNELDARGIVCAGCDGYTSKAFNDASKILIARRNPAPNR
jgi:hypothetical protein